MFAQIVNATTGLVITIRILWPNGGRFKGVPLYFQNSGFYRFAYFGFSFVSNISIHYHTQKQWKILN